MRCPFCGHEETQVKDSRPSDDGGSIRRRRSCPSCGGRFTTFERIQLRDLTVVKSGDRRQPFDREKIIRSMQVALRKRPISIDQIEKAATGIVRQLESYGEPEIPAADIGGLVMKALIALDIVGYIRYASVYKDFREPEDFNAFVEEIQSLQSENQLRVNE
ncbi:MAG: transcriptional regulator NrdR [Micavibrio aeruginosavorus]|uniref:Transcriptional repressor NrdR n=1 Tax=Micavibrio aeruginosavorus TaxID=349221 RepID=A0A2W5A0U5_9BACT|nr:MAG: transcriptional regulator NrdR [Micavibrio aeruginosavorus]